MEAESHHTTRPRTLKSPESPLARGKRWRAEAERIRRIFESAGIETTAAEVAEIPYALDLIRAHPGAFLHSNEFRLATEAIHTLAQTLPLLKVEAEELAAQEAQAGRASWAARYAKDVERLLIAAEPMVLPSRSRRGWWHGWARALALEVGVIFRRHDQAADFGNADGRALGAVVALLGLAGVEVTPEAVREVFRKRAKTRLANFPKVCT